MGMIIHEAGGAISNGRGSIRDIMPEGIDDVTPIYVGGKEEIRLIEKYMLDECCKQE
jgi:fructose-1,6-bisphosphatase I